MASTLQKLCMLESIVFENSKISTKIYGENGKGLVKRSMVQTIEAQIRALHRSSKNRGITILSHIAENFEW